MMDMLTEAHESLDNFLDVTAGIDCRMVPQARRNLARLMEGLQDQRHKIASLETAIKSQQTPLGSNHLVAAMSELAQQIKKGKSETSLDQIRADLDAPDPTLVREHEEAMARIDSRRAIMVAMVPGWTHAAAVALSLVAGGLIGWMI